MHARNELVKPAFSSTFQWLLDPIEDTRAHGSPFRRWLSSPSHGKDIFWLSGKAGSGKSTLMKYLHSHAMLKELLKPWMASHKTSQIALAGFYFHERGKVDLQKSREGLIRSILLQLLAQVPSMKYVVLDPDDRKKLVQPSESTEFSWTWKQLRKALLCFMREKPQSLAIYIYADGLDEYLNTETLNQGLRDDDEGSTGQFISQKSKGHREISESFLELAEFCNTKICLSSRPLTAFDDNFGDFSRLKLEDLTRHDITLFVSEKLGTASARNKICSQELETIVRMTVQAASGVFLWVVLVVENLIRRMSDGDTIEELKTWLRNTPEELIGVDGLYMRMLQDIAPHDRRQGQHYLEVVRNARHQVSPLLLSFSEDTRKEVLEVLYRYLTDEELRMRLNRIQSRLKSRCAGLLELHQRSHTFVSSPTLITPRLQTFTFSEGLKLQSPFWCHSNIVVDFFHQTAKEFVQSRKVQRILEANYIFDYRSLTYACIRRIKCLRIHPRDDVEFWAHLKDAMIYAQATELATGKPDVEVLDHLDFAANRALQDVARSLQTKDYRAPLELKYGFLHYGYHWSIMERQAHEGRIYSWRDDFLSWAVQANLSLYLNAKMSESGYIQKVGRPLLAYAVAPPPMSSVQQHSGAYRDEFGKYMSSPKTVEILLKNGESPNEVHMGRTIWQLILQQAIRAPPYGCQDEIAVTKVMRLMLRAGADPNAKYWYHRSLLYTVLMFGIAPQAERKIRVRSLVKHGAVLFIGEKESIRQTRDLEWAHSPMQEWQEQVAPTAMEWEAWERGFEAAAPQVDAVSDTNSGDQRTGRISKRRPAETKTLKADVEDQYRDLPNLDLQDPDLNNADADPVDQSAGQWKCSTM